MAPNETFQKLLSYTDLKNFEFATESEKEIIQKIKLDLSEDDLNYSFSDLENELLKLYGDPTKIITKGSKRGIIWFNDSNGFYTIAEFQDSKFYGKSIELKAASPKNEAEKSKIKKFIFPENDM